MFIKKDFSTIRNNISLIHFVEQCRLSVLIISWSLTLWPDSKRTCQLFTVHGSVFLFLLEHPQQLLVSSLTLLSYYDASTRTTRKGCVTLDACRLNKLRATWSVMERRWCIMFLKVPRGFWRAYAPTTNPTQTLLKTTAWKRVLSTRLVWDCL